MVDIKENHIQFEGKKLSMVHTKREGHVLRLAINPTDSPEELFRDAVDQRYLVVMVKLADETDDIVPINPEGQKALRLFQALVKAPDFREMLYLAGDADDMSEEAAVSGLKAKLGIQSRQELKNNPSVRQALLAIRDDFEYNIRPR